MSRTISPEETEKLFKFCKDHYIEYYDLQLELVDHLASAIEEQWKAAPELGFNIAVKNTFGKFGITGFSKIKVQKERELNRKYNNLLWKYLLEFYKLPKIVMTLAFTMVLFSLLRIVDNNLWVIAPYFIVLTTAIIYYYYKIFPKEFKVKTKPGKSFMLLNKLKDVQFMVVFAVQIPIQIANFRNISKIDWIENNDLGEFIISLLIITLTIALYGQFLFVPKKIKEHFMEQFGEFVV